MNQSSAGVGEHVQKKPQPVEPERHSGREAHPLRGTVAERRRAVRGVDGQILRFRANGCNNFFHHVFARY